MAMKPEEKIPGKFYQLFKVHKEHEGGTVPPGRPIISISATLQKTTAYMWTIF